MTLSFGTLRSREEMATSEAVPGTERSAPPELPPARVVPRAVLDAQRERLEILEDAARRADALRQRAQGEVAALRERTIAEAQAEAATALASKVLALAAHEAESDRRALDRSLSLARLLAERLLGEALALDPSRVVHLAETALAEARGARRIEITAHPDDAELLREAVAQARLEHVTRVNESRDLARGALRLVSEIGVLDAQIAPQLDRLVQRLRESFPA